MLPLLLLVVFSLYQQKHNIAIKYKNYSCSMVSKTINNPGLEPVLNHTEKSCIATYYKQFSTNLKIKNRKINTRFLARAFGLSGPSQLF